MSTLMTTQPPLLSVSFTFIAFVWVIIFALCIDTRRCLTSTEQLMLSPCIYFEHKHLLTLIAFVLTLNSYALCVEVMTVLMLVLCVGITSRLTFIEQLMLSPPPFSPKKFPALEFFRLFLMDCLCKQISLTSSGTGWSSTSEKHKDNCSVVFRIITFKFDFLLISWKEVFTVAVLQKKVI